MQLCNMAEIEKEEVEFPACATLWQGNLHKVAAPYFLLFMYMVQLYEGDWTILRMLGCRVETLPSTKQIVEVLFVNGNLLQYINSLPKHAIHHPWLHYL